MVWGIKGRFRPSPRDGRYRVSLGLSYEGAEQVVKLVTGLLPLFPLLLDRLGFFEAADHRLLLNRSPAVGCLDVDVADVADQFDTVPRHRNAEFLRAGNFRVAVSGRHLPEIQGRRRSAVVLPEDQAHGGVNVGEHAQQ